ncbi:MAG: type II secretion system protein [Candidatus Aminicenantes bacterium]|nr:type II secretion system protein [Candidatus Aminicenantes bacterium]
METHKTGFTLIETLISITMISLSTLLLMKCMIVALHGVKNSDLRFRVGLVLENKKNSLLGQKYISPLFSEGTSMERTGDVMIITTIINITHNLKKIVLKGSRNNFNLVLVFYKSGILREVGNE